MNFLITGAAGFLGSSLANQLAREGHQVRGLDDLSTGDPQVLAPDVHFTRGDVNDRPKLWTLLQDVDVVYHLAARVSVQESILYPRDYNAVNVGGTVQGGDGYISGSVYAGGRIGPVTVYKHLSGGFGYGGGSIIGLADIGAVNIGGDRKSVV